MPEVCTRCGDSLESLEGGFGAVLHGFGDAGIIDTFGTEISVTFCAACASEMLKSNQWLLSAVTSVLNINHGHKCLDDTIHWVSESSCQIDPDHHGWAKVHAVVPTVAIPRERRAPLVTPSGKMARYGLFASSADAVELADALSSRGISCRTIETLSGNERIDGEIVDPQEWTQWWPSYNQRWVRSARLRFVRETVKAVASNPGITLRHYARRVFS